MSTFFPRPLNALILRLYREGREVPLGNFQEWALDELQGLIDFDSACWGNASVNPPDLHEIHLRNCERQILDDYPAFADEDFFRAALIASPGVSINTSDLTTRARYLRTRLYRELGKRFKVEWSLGTLVIEPISSLYELLTVWRHDRRRPFSEAERQSKELLMPHLVEAHRAVRLRHFLRTPNSTPREWALADARGFLREASPAFVARLRSEWPEWRGRSLPEPLASLAGAGQPYASATVSFDVKRSGELRWIAARPERALDQLSPREGEIARRYACGETHTAIATSLSLSPATVRNHVANCFRKLAVNNKAELVHRLAERA